MYCSQTKSYAVTTQCSVVSDSFQSILLSSIKQHIKVHLHLKFYRNYLLKIFFKCVKSLGGIEGMLSVKGKMTLHPNAHTKQYNKL